MAGSAGRSARRRSGRRTQCFSFRSTPTGSVSPAGPESEQPREFGQLRQTGAFGDGIPWRYAAPTEDAGLKRRLGALRTDRQPSQAVAAVKGRRRDGSSLPGAVPASHPFREEWTPPRRSHGIPCGREPPPKRRESHQNDTRNYAGTWGPWVWARALRSYQHSYVKNIRV